MGKNRIKVKFIDFWEGFDPSDSIFMKVLNKYYDVVLEDNADYVFFSSFGNSIYFEPQNCIKIYWTGENEEPNFNVCDYACAYGKIVYGDRYFRLPNYFFNETYKQRVELMEHKHESIGGGKHDFCSFVVSNGQGAKERDMIFDKLNEYKKINSGGKYRNNIGGPVDDKLLFESRHKFSICFENTSHKGYTTEKIVEAFAAQTVPIYWGDPEIGEVFNQNAFINVLSFESIDKAIKKIIEIDNNDKLYLSMLRQPALTDPKYSYNNTFREFEKWLLNIVNPPVEKAKRAPKGYWQDNYYWKWRNIIETSTHPFRTILRRLLK